MSMIAPCKDCKNRHEACHSDCKDYKVWKEYEEAKHKAIERAKEADREYCKAILKHMNRGNY